MINKIAIYTIGAVSLLFLIAYFITARDTADVGPFEGCRITECRNNVSTVCCGCEYDGPFFYIETDSRELIESCGQIIGIPNKCEQLAQNCR